MSRRWTGLAAVFVVAVLGSLAGYPRETAAVATLLLLFSVYGLTLGVHWGQLLRGDAFADALIGGAAFATVATPLVKTMSWSGLVLGIAAVAGVGWVVPVSSAFVRIVLGPLALVVASVELVAGGPCGGPLLSSLRGMLVGGVAVALIALGLVAVVARRSLFLDGIPPLSLLRPARWALLSFGIIELALFAISPAGVDLSESWSTGPVVALVVLGSAIVALAALSPDVAERAIGLTLFLAWLWLVLIQVGFEGSSEATCQTPVRSIGIVVVFSTAAGIGASLLRRSSPRQGQ